MLKILIVTDSVTPDFSPRVSFLARNLVALGHSVSVLAEDVENPLYVVDASGVNISRTKFYKSNPDSFCRKIEWTVKSVLNLCFDYKSDYFLKIWQEAVKGQSFDIVFCSTFNYFPLKPAYILAEQLSVPFITDIRDLAEQFTHCEYQRHHMPFFSKLYDKSQRVRRDQYIVNSDYVITVSPWHKRFIYKQNIKVGLIYNGYDSSMFFPAEVKSDTFDILYTGKWLGQNMQDPTLLFEALERILLSDKVDFSKIRLKWILSKGVEDMQSLLSKYPYCSSISVFSDRVQYSEIPALINSASIILVLTNEYSQNGPKGIMTTKFFEALGCEKPVLNVKSDGMCLSEVIKKTNAGLTATTVDEVASFIFEKYKEWESVGYTHQNVNKQKRQTFDRIEQSKQFEKIFFSKTAQ